MKTSKLLFAVAIFCTAIGTASAQKISDWVSISVNPVVQVRWETEPAGIWGGGPKIEFKCSQDVNVRYEATVEYDGGGYPSKRITKTMSGTTRVSRIDGAVVEVGGTGQALVIKNVTGTVLK